ncbi:MAG: POTRA domain-containing protein, partial [Chthoniobacteraceae bacterium]
MHFRFLSLALLAVFALLPGPNPAFAQQAPPTVRAIEIQYAGPATVSREKILANMRTQVGRPYSQDVVEEDIRNLYSSGNISNVRIFGEAVEDGVKVTVVVAAQPQISAVTIEGATRIKESRLRKEITVKPNDALNEGTLEQDRQKLQAYYAGRGFTETEVTYNVVPDEQAGTAKVVFTINEGGKTTIKSIKFEGNEALTDK